MTVTALQPLSDWKSIKPLIACSPEIIRIVQQQLAAAGLYKGAIDGIAGKKTIKAFATFKHQEHLEYPDILGSTTAAALLDINRDHPLVTDELTTKLDDYRGPKIDLPGKGLTSPNELVINGGHFTWGEFTKNLTRIPVSSTVTKNIIKLAIYLEEIRDLLEDRSISINSGYRDPISNRRVGGVSNSRHIIGDAADIVVSGLPPIEVYNRLNSVHGSKGGLGRSSVFTHIDLRGYRARWNYGRG